MMKLNGRLLQKTSSLLLALTTLWAAAQASGASDLAEAAEALGSAFPAALVRFERAGVYPASSLALPAALTLYMTPLLLPAAAQQPVEKTDTVPEPSHGAPERTQDASAPAAQTPVPDATPEPVSALAPARDNGVPSTTLRPSDPAGYLLCGKVYVRNASAASLSEDELSLKPPLTLSADAPQVLIVHTHGCEAYTMPAGEEYVASDDHRTLDETYSVLRVGDEIARVLEDAGIGVVHDRTLHDYPSYSGAYERSLATINRCRAEHPSLVYILDVHRDAVAGEDGQQYKLLCAEAPGAAQLEFVIGSDGGGLSHENWRDNLRLACAVQSTLLEEYPTLMRPIVVRNSRYNQQVSPGSLLVEVGTAGNSLDEALAAARLFAEGFAKTIQAEE
ncbi:MAG: stage II sporulation protein P [Ruminococcaceae bacterium]|nr:stage II sporulation protein P [Oscillospiraceae bacterium]